MRDLTRRLALVVTGSVALAACGNSTASTSGTFAVQLTDAPFPYGQVSRADIFVVRIDAKVAAPSDAEASDETQMSGWTTVATPNASINLLDLTGGKTHNLGAAKLTTGVYQGFRMIIDASQSSITLTDGTKPTITWPSAARTGIKINLDHSISVTADSSVMILDFDLGRSFVMRGNSIATNGLLFKPVIRAVATELTGSASGSVHADTPTGAAMAGVTVEVLTAGSLITDAVSTDVVRSTQTDASGNYKVSFLLPGTYVVRATPLASTLYLPALLTGGLTITSGVDASGKLIVVTK
jgi:Domain of unknown function (DUF4382)/Carboxypeptidase regulatory-like domain